MSKLATGFFHDAGQNNGRSGGGGTKDARSNIPIQVDFCALYPMLHITSTAHVVNPYTKSSGK